MRPYELTLLGAFRLVDPSGARIEVPSRKGRALLALLATSPTGERTRGWVQSKLWGAAAPNLSSMSLRRELSDLRGILNSQHPLLLVESDRIGLDLDRMLVDSREGVDPSPSSSNRALRRGEFLEGLDLPGEEAFEDWLREERGSHADASMAAVGVEPAPATSSTGPIYSEPVVDPLVRLGVFGSLSARGFDGRPVLPRGRRAQAILCYLALSGDEAVPRQRLIGLLWSRRPEDLARASLRQSLLEFRRALGAAAEVLLAADRDEVSLNHRYVWIDGLSRASAQDRLALADEAPGALLETLVGLDPVFDRWIGGLKGDLSRLAHGETDAPRTPVAASLLADRMGSPVLEVAPLQHFGHPGADGHLAPALTQEIVTALARFRWMQVRLVGSAAKREATYRVEGHISKLASGYRVAVRLVDRGEGSAVVWTHAEILPPQVDYDSVLRLAEQIIRRIDPEVLAIETRKAETGHGEADSGYHLTLRAMPLLYEFERESWLEARLLLREALKRDPHFGRSHAFSALCRLTGLAQGWCEDPEFEIQRIVDEARIGATHDPYDSLSLSLCAHISSFLSHDFEAARDLYDRAIRANPSCGFAWGYSALTFAYLGDTDEASARLARASELMLYEPLASFIQSFETVVAYFTHDWPNVVALCRRHLARRPTLLTARKLLIGALCFLGRRHEARAEHGILLGYEPDFRWSRYLVTYPFGREADRHALEAALRASGLLDGARGPASTRLTPRSFEKVRSPQFLETNP